MDGKRDKLVARRASDIIPRQPPSPWRVRKISIVDHDDEEGLLIEADGPQDQTVRIIVPFWLTEKFEACMSACMSVIRPRTISFRLEDL